MSDTQPFDVDPIDHLQSGSPSTDAAARFADDLVQAASSEEPVRIDATLADLFAPPTSQARRKWRPSALVRPAATVAAAFVAVLMLGAGAVALVGPELVETFTGGERSDAGMVDAGTYEDDISTDRPETENGAVEVRVVDDVTNDDAAVVIEDDTAREEKPDANAVNEEAVAIWVECMEASFDAWLTSFGEEATVPEGLFGSCPTSDEGSLGAAGHAYKDALADWLQCASQYGHEVIKGGAEADGDIFEACGDIPTYGEFGIDVPDDAEAKVRDRVDDVNRRSDELADDRNRAGEGHDQGGGDVRNDSSDEGRSPGGRTGEG